MAVRGGGAATDLNAHMAVFVGRPSRCDSCECSGFPPTAHVARTLNSARSLTLPGPSMSVSCTSKGGIDGERGIVKEKKETELDINY